MGIRILILDFGLSERSVDPDLSWKIEDLNKNNPKSKTSGQAYLAARKVHYEQEDNRGKEIDTIIAQYRKAFSGLYVKSEVEYQQCRISGSSLTDASRGFRIFQQSALRTKIQNRILSIYFLVPRDAVEHFRQVFRKISQNTAAKLLLSGPWPPYNFVIPERKVQGSKVQRSRFCVSDSP